MFRADAALVVTWFNTASAISGRSDIDAGQTATYQVRGKERKREETSIYSHH